MKKVLIASDHAGFHGKEFIKKTLDELGVVYQDLGTNSLDSVDYPDYAELVAEGVASGRAERGILVCGSGIGREKIKPETIHDYKQKSFSLADRYGKR